MSEKTGADALVGALEACGVRMAFGVPGTQTVALFDALSRAKEIRTVLASDEGMAGFMAHGHFRASGRLSCAVSIPGPGLTNTLTAVAQSREDSVALVHLVVTSSVHESRPFGLQPAYLGKLSPHFYKEEFSISARSEVERTVVQACERALAGEPGPVLLAVTPEVLYAEAGGSAVTASPQSANGGVDVELETLAVRLAQSGRICLMTGQGAALAGESLIALVETTGALVVTTASGRGTVSDDHPRTVCGDFGGWGVQLVNQLFQQSDLVLAVGCKFTHNGSGGFDLSLPPAKFARIDTSDEVLRVGYPASTSVVADASTALAKVLHLLKANNRTAPAWTEQERADWRSKFEAARAQSVRHQADLLDWPGHRPADFFRALREVMPGDSHLITDSGQHQIWTRQHYRVRAPRGLIIPADFQSMGFALPVAIGAKLARPEVPVVAILGDGGFLMSGWSLIAAVRESIPLVVIVFNDGSLTQIQYQQWQEYGKDFATTPGAVSFPAVAAALGMDYALLEGDPRGVLKESLALGRPRLLELRLQGATSIAKAALVARTKSVIRRGPGMTLLWNALKRFRKSR